MAKGIVVTFWGVRGMVAAAGRHTARYGGNTPCISISYKDTLIICDAGSGIRYLGAELTRHERPIRATVLFSHMHWDHFTGLPYFEPLYGERNEITLAGMGYDGESFKAVLGGVTGPPYFPITPRHFTARVRYRTITGRPFRIGDVRVQSFSCFHPGGSMGWKFMFPNGKTLIHIPTNEPSLRNRDQLLAWMKDVDMLIHDAQFSPQAYAAHRGWGHSPYTYPVEMAISAQAKRLFLFHYGPAIEDAQLQRWLKEARQTVRRYRSRLRVDLSREGLRVVL